MAEVNTIIHGDIRDVARQLPSGSVHCIVTSPPYYSLRDYNIGGQIGLESTPEEYVQTIVEIFRELRRVLRHDGTLWLVIGDTYSNEGKNGGTTWGKNYTSAAGGYQTVRNNRPKTGMPAKNLYGIPWRVALAMQADGWWLRSDIIWSKCNSMPESVTDRPTKSHEYVFLLTKSPRYFYDAMAIQEKTSRLQGARPFGGAGNGKQNADRKDYFYPGDNGYRNKRSVWEIALQPYAEVHFATYPPALIEPMILAGCPARVCAKCGASWVRIVEKGFTAHDGSTDSQYQAGTTAKRLAQLSQAARESGGEYVNQRRTIGFEPTCDCNASTTPGIVLDPFIGSGTTAEVAIKNGRNWLGVELNPDYIDLAYKRLRERAAQPPLIVIGADL